MPDPPSISPDPQSCSRMPCNCMCIGYRSEIHRQAEVGWHLNPAECHKCCIESSQCASDYLLSANVSTARFPPLWVERVEQVPAPKGCSPSSNAFPSSKIYIGSPYMSIHSFVPASCDCARTGGMGWGTHTSPHPLHGYTISSSYSIGDPGISGDSISALYYRPRNPHGSVPAGVVYFGQDFLLNPSKVFDLYIKRFPQWSRRRL